MSYDRRIDLSSLPAELIARTANQLPLRDLIALRLSSIKFAQAGFDALLPFMRSNRKFDNRSDDGIASLILLAQTPKAKDTLKGLVFRSKIASLDKIFSVLRFPQLETLVVEDSVMWAAHLIDLLSNHASTLRQLRLEYIKLITTPWKLKAKRTSGWSRVLEIVVTRLQLTKLTTLSLSYYTRKSEPVQVTPYPKTRCGALLAQNCCAVEEYEDGAFIDLDVCEAVTTEAVSRVAYAFTDQDGKERFRKGDDKKRPARYPDLCELGVEDPEDERICMHLAPNGTEWGYLEN